MVVLLIFLTARTGCRSVAGARRRLHRNIVSPLECSRHKEACFECFSATRLVPVGAGYVAKRLPPLKPRLFYFSHHYCPLTDVRRPFSRPATDGSSHNISDHSAGFAMMKSSAGHICALKPGASLCKPFAPGRRLFAERCNPQSCGCIGRSTATASIAR